MRRFFSVLTAAFVAVSFSSMLYAQPPATSTEKKAPAKHTTTAKKAGVMAATGSVSAYDDATKTLSVKTKAGEEQFTLGADAKIMAGAKTAAATELAAGKNVKVTYMEEGGKKMATKVNITPERAASKTPKSAKK